MARKLLSLIVALAMVLTSMSFAFAADAAKVSEGITDAKVKVAVEKLATLGMTDGVEDGKYHPERTLTRAEATTFVVRALGLEAAAKAAAGATAFSDVAASDWYAGYVNVAQGQGLVEGMGDGTFAPNAKFTYAQALTILVRALGYKNEFLPGAWPGNYIAKAAEESITSGVTISGDADRGAMAIMLSNTLDAKVVTATSFKTGEISYTKSDKTLAKEKLKLDKAEVRIVGNARLDNSLKSDDVKVALTKSMTKGDTDIKGYAGADQAIGVETTLKLASGVNVDTLVGTKVNVYVKDKENVICVEPTSDSTIVWDHMDGFTNFDTGANIDTDVKLRWAGKAYNLKNGNKAFGAAGTSASDFVTIYTTLDGTATKLDTAAKFPKEVLATANTDQYYGRFVIEGNKVVFIDIMGYETGKKNLLVKSVDADKSIVTYINKTADEANINFASAYQATNVYSQKGEVMSLKDIKPLDVLCVAKSRADGKDTANVIVFRNTKTGKVVSVDAASKVELDGGVGNTDVGGDVTFSKDNNTSYKTNYTKDIGNDFYGTAVTLVIDNNKKIRHIFGTTTTSSTLYALLKSADPDTLNSKTVKLYLTSDETVSYQFEDEDKVYETAPSVADLAGRTQYKYFYDELTAANAATTPVILKYKLTKDGKIAKNSIITYYNGKTGMSNASVIAVNQSFGDTTVNSKDAGTGIITTYYVDKDVKIFDAYDAITASLDKSKYKVSKWDALKGKDVSGSANVLALVDSTNTKNVNAFVVLGNLGSATKDIKSAYIIKKNYIDGKDYAYFKVYGVADVQKYEVGTDTLNLDIAKTKEAAVIINVTSSGKADIYGASAGATARAAGKNMGTVAGVVYAVDGSSVTVGTNSSVYKYTVASDAVVYSGGDVKAISNVDVDDVIVGILKDGIIQVIALADTKEKNENQSYGTLPAGVEKFDEKIICQRTKAGTEGYYIAAPANGTACALYTNSDGKIGATVKY